MIRSPRGTNDILPNEISKWQRLESIIQEITRLFGYQEIRTPIFEATEVFSRSIGESSDIVNKEMYTFRDRSDNLLTLRPEMTAALVRACIQHNIAARGELEKLWYYGPFFRYERPQKGRFRQFHQFGAECLSSSQPESDAEVIQLAISIIEKLGITEYTLLINSLGNDESRKNYINDLVEYFTKYKAELSEDSQKRLETNPLRILDSKDKNDIELMKEAPEIYNSLDEESKKHFNTVLEILDASDINYEISNKLVRGLDYYSHTVFEFQSNELGAQDSFGGGGRYDGLFEQLGGKPTPAVGFAFGIERLLLILDKIDVYKESEDKIDFYIISGDENYIPISSSIANALRKLNYSVKSDLTRKSFRSQLKAANKENAKYTIIIAEKEFNENGFSMKNMESGEQQLIPFSELNNISNYL